MKAAIRILVAFTLLIVATATAYAADGYRSIVLECKTPPGRVLNIRLDASVTVCYHYGMMEIAGKHVYVQLPLDNVAVWKYSRQDVDGVVGEPDRLSPETEISVCRASIGISGLQGHTTIMLYDLSGRVVLSDTVSASDYTVEIGHLPAGIYVLAVGNDTYKIRVE